MRLEQPTDSLRIPAGARAMPWSVAVAAVFQAKQCHNCHSLDDKGGQRGPALDSVALRLTADQLIRQVIQGGGNMPAYGKNLSPAETTALGGGSLRRCTALVNRQHVTLLRAIALGASEVTPGRPSHGSSPCLTCSRCRLLLAVRIALVGHRLFYLRGGASSSKCSPPNLIPVWRLVAFMCGSSQSWTAVASP